MVWTEISLFCRKICAISEPTIISLTWKLRENIFTLACIQVHRERERDIHIIYANIHTDTTQHYRPLKILIAVTLMSPNDFGRPAVRKRDNVLLPTMLTKVWTICGDGIGDGINGIGDGINCQCSQKTGSNSQSTHMHTHTYKTKSTKKVNNNVPL